MGIKDFTQNLAELLPVLSESIITYKTKQSPLKHVISFIYKQYHHMQDLVIRTMSQS